MNGFLSIKSQGQLERVNDELEDRHPFFILNICFTTMVKS